MEEDALNPNEMDEGNDFFARQRRLQERKELKAVDHSQIEYNPFKRNFYHEVPEISRLTPDQVELQRQELGNVKVRGRDIANPISNWYQCGLNDRILNSLVSKKNF
jgi:ATP-dependent RNA helicase DDX46/PRP5